MNIFQALARVAVALALLSAMTTTAATPTTSSTTASTCVALPSTSACSNILPYSSFIVNVNVTALPLCINSQEAENGIANAPQVWASVSAGCASTLSVYQCSIAYPPCGKSVCMQQCDDVLTACSSATDLAIVSKVVPLQCSQLGLSNSSTTECTYVNTVITPPNVPLQKCETYTGQVCKGIIDYPVLLPFRSAQFIEESVASKIEFMFNIIPRSFTGCNQNLIKYICSQFFPRCDNTSASSVFSPSLASSSVSIPLPAPLCSSGCSDYASTCGLYMFGLFNTITSSTSSSLSSSSSAISMLHFLMPQNCSNVADRDYRSTAAVVAASGTTCIGVDGTITNSSSSSSISSSSGSSLFPINAPYPQNSIQYVLSTGLTPKTVVNVNCNNYDGRALSSFVAPINCPAPLVRYDADLALTVPANAYCAVPCPFPFLTISAQNALVSMILILCFLSFICSTFMLLTWLIFPVKRRQFLVLNFCIGCFFLSLTLLIEYLGNINDILATASKDGVKPSEQQDWNLCVVTGLSSIFFALAVQVWWTLIAVDLLLRISSLTQPTASQAKRQQYIYVAIGWGIPSALCTLGLSISAFGGGTAIPNCTFAVLSPYAAWADWTVFYVPGALCVLVASLSLIGVMVIVSRSAAAVSQNSNRVPKSAKQRLSMADPSVATSSSLSSSAASLCLSVIFSFLARVGKKLRPHLRLLLFLLQFLILFFAITVVRLNNWRSNSQNVAQGTAWVTCLLFGGSSATCGPSVGGSAAAFFIMMFAISGQGCINFLSYGTQPQNFALWSALLRGRGVGTLGGHSENSHSSKSKTTDASKTGKSRDEKKTANERDASPNGSPRTLQNKLKTLNGDSPQPATRATMYRYKSDSAGSSFSTLPTSPLSPSMMPLNVARSSSVISTPPRDSASPVSPRSHIQERDFESNEYEQVSSSNPVSPINCNSDNQNMVELSPFQPLRQIDQGDDKEKHEHGSGINVLVPQTVLEHA